jgi:glycosyltransferase involved in cell wall biosynthesis
VNGPDEGCAQVVPSGRSLRVAMLLHGQYPWDERVKREAQALVDAGHEVDVVCLRQFAGEPARETVDGVRVFRLPLRRRFTRARSSYFAEYGAAFAGCFWMITFLNARRRYDAVQVHTLPDVLVFSAVAAKLTGAKIILDMHDLMPELYMSKFGLGDHAPIVRILRTTEGASTRFAHAVITASELFRERLVASGVPEDQVTVVLNTADAVAFPPPPDARLPGSGDGFTVFWHGTMVRRYGLDIAIRAVASLRETIPGLRLIVYGEGECSDELEELTRALGAEDVVDFRGQVSHLELAGHIASADVGIVPNRPDVHIESAYPTKLFEFVQMGVPVVATRTRVLEGRFGNEAIVFTAADPESVALEGARQMARRARAQCAPVSWQHMKAAYVVLVAEVCGGPGPRDQAAHR